MSDRIELDPDEARVRSLIRRSDGPVTVRPFRPYAARMSALPVAVGAVGLLAVGLVIGTALGARRQEVASPPLATGGIAPGATHTPAPTATPGRTASPEPGVPVSAGAVAEAGVLYIQGADDLVYRYDGRSGELRPVTGRSRFVQESTDGVDVLERDESATHLRWNGEVVSAGCGLPVVAFSGTGYCAYHEADDSITIGEAGVHDRTPLAPADWRVGEVSWSEAAARVAFLRIVPGSNEADRAHNSLWVRESEGARVHQMGEPRKLYEPASSSAFVFAPRWSPDGKWIAVLELGAVSQSIAADGANLILVEVATGRATDLGTTVGRDWISWSPDGELTFVRGGGRATWNNKRLVLRAADGSERQIALPDGYEVQLAPAWSSSGHLAFVYGPGAADLLGTDYMNGVGIGDRRGMVVDPKGSRREVRCPDAALEGIRPSADGHSLLLLCRTPGEGSYPLSIWFVGPNAKTPVPLVHGLGQSAESAGGFGYYGLQPYLPTIAAWSLAADD